MIRAFSLAAALMVAAQIGYKLLYPAVPVFEAMGVFSLLGLAANGVCLYLLWRHRFEDVLRGWAGTPPAVNRVDATGFAGSGSESDLAVAGRSEGR